MICYYCGKRISDPYYQDPYGNIVCASHSITQCYCCHRFCSPKESRQIKGYGYFCKECQIRLVTQESAVQIAGMVNQFYLNHGVPIPAYTLHLVGAEKILVEANNTTPLGLAYSSQPYKILMLRHLSRTGFAGVLAHEVLHLWQYHYNIQLSLLLCEGLCELGSYLFLESIGKPEAEVNLRCLAQNDDEIYGHGYRVFRKVYDRFGWRGVMKAAFLKNQNK